MCDFNSTAWRMIGQDMQCAHLPSNSHSEAIKAAGWRDNEPNRKTIIFEAEWDGQGDMPSSEKLIRNCAECPERLVKRIRSHYSKLQEAITSGKYLDTYFSDTEKWHDVWTAAMKNDVTPDFSYVTSFAGYIYVRENATLTAPALVKAGNIDVMKNATLTAPALVKAGNIYVRENATLTAPALAEVAGYIDVMKNATLTAPALVKAGYIYVRENATLTAPKLKRKL